MGLFIRLCLSLAVLLSDYEGMPIVQLVKVSRDLMCDVWPVVSAGVTSGPGLARLGLDLVELVLELVLELGLLLLTAATTLSRRPAHTPHSTFPHFSEQISAT